MSNADYKQSGVGQFATFVKTDVALSYLDTTVDYTVFNAATIDAIQPGQAVLWDDEIVRIETTGIRTMTVKRGCADTVPQAHAAGSLLWILTGAVGTDKVERSAGEAVAVKIQPYTIGGGPLPITSAKPNGVNFNYRYFRPYAPAFVKANDAVWYSGAAINDATGGMNVTWRDRNRVMQADQLVGHMDAQMTPEAGTTYTLRIYNAASTLLRTEPGIRGNAFLYQHEKALKDFGYPGSAQDGFATFVTERDEFESLQGYVVPLHVEPSASPIESVWQAFWQRTMEAPYLFNTRNGITPTEQRALAMAARPSDRMSDGYNFVRHWVEWVDEDDGNGGTISVPYDRNEVAAIGDYQPWFNLAVGVTELETVISAGTLSLWDGVRIPAPGLLADKLALMGDEIIVFKGAAEGGGYKIGRGVADTVPARHIAGTRVILFESVPVVDATARSGTVDYRFQPKTFGPLPDPNGLPSVPLSFNQRALRPYNMGQLVVGGRPWYEEAQVLFGLPLAISWAWRNRVTQLAWPIDHTYHSLHPEVGTQAKLTFYYETPSVTPGVPATQHVLRTVYVDPLNPEDPISTPGAYSYPYSFAQADGNAAGTALGICGTVVIYCRLETIRDGLTSLQGYIIPIRVPSFPC
jgi:hypothetical protein